MIRHTIEEIEPSFSGFGWFGFLLPTKNRMRLAI
jgi:hypothetical protein